MKRLRNSLKLLSLILSLLLLLGSLPAWAKADVDRLSAAGLVAGSGALGAADALTVEQVNQLAARVSGKTLLGALEAANRSEQVFRRHSTLHRHEDAFCEGEVFFTNDLYADAKSATYCFGEDYSRYMTPNGYDEHFADTDALSEALMTPEDYAAELEDHLWYVTFTPAEVLESVRAQDGELFVTTTMMDADAIDERLAYNRGIFGDSYAAEYVDSAFAPIFDETAERREITVVFAPGTPEEQTCRYAVPEGVNAYPVYHGEPNSLYEDAACTQPYQGRNGRMEMTIYVKVGD